MTADPPDGEGVALLLANDDPEARRRGAQRIVELPGPAAIAMLVIALGDADWRVRKEAVAVAAALAPRGSVVDRLAAALDDRANIGLRNAAVEALVRVGADAVPAAIQALEALDADGRKLAVEVLGGVPDLAGTRALARALDDADVNVRAAAAEALGSASLAGAEAQRLAIAALIDSLRGDEPLRRLAAMGSLARLEADLPWELSEPLAADPLLRRQAIAAAGRSHDAAAVAALARATGDRSSAIAREALVALVACLTAAPPQADLGGVARREIQATEGAEDRVRAFARDTEDAQVRGAALVALGLLQAGSDIPELVRGLSDDDVSGRAELGLRWFGQGAVASLLDEGRRASPSVRAATLSLVALLDERPDVATLDALRDALGAEAGEVRAAALQALAATGGAADLACLAPHATSADPRVAATACAALTTLAARHVAESRAMAETIAPDSPDAVVGCILRGASASARATRTAGEGESDAITADLSFLRAALDHDDVRVRRAAVDALAVLGGRSAADVVARALADEERDVVLAAVRALGRMGQAEPLLALVEGVDDTAVVAAALRALGKASPTLAFDAAWSLVRADDPRIALAAVETIGHLRGPRRDEGLILALEHPDPGVVKGALTELSRETSPDILARVARCLDSESYEVRRFAAELLAGAPDPTTHARIRARLDRETDPAVREALALALAAGAAGSGPLPSISEEP